MASTPIHLSLSPPSPATQPRSHPTPTTATSPKPKPTIRSKLSKLCQDGKPHLARQVFDALPRPNTVLWNTIIIGFVCNNFPEEALSIYARMKSSSTAKNSGDPYTFSSTLKACAETRNLAAGKAVHCHVIRSLRRPSGIVQNSVLNMYSVCASPEKDYVRKVFDKMPKRSVVAWNTLVTWHARAERYSEAFLEFERMVRVARVKPSPVSFVGVFPALSGLNDRRNAELLYGMALKMGKEYMKDSFVVSSAIFMFSELGRVESARKVFDFCETKSTEIWNTMIGSYVQNNLPLESIKLLLDMISRKDTELDEVTLLSALAAVSQLQRPDFARETHAFVLRNSPETAPIATAIENAIVSMYSKCDSVGSAFKAFHSMMSERDLVSWNTMVSSLVQSGSDEEAILIVREMLNQGFQIDHVTVSALLSAASNMRDSFVGKQTHGYMIRNGIEFEGMESYLADMYSKSGLVKSLKTIFEKGNSDGRDLATWNSIIAGYSQNELSGEAILAFRLMIERKLNPNSITLASILPACTATGNAESGKQIHAFAIRRSLDKNVFVGSALIDTYSKSGEISLAENLFLRQMSKDEKNSVTYTNMISGYGQHGMGSEALSLFRSMKGSNVEPDSVTFVAILSACSHCGLVNEGLEIFESMKTNTKIRPSIAHFCCVADMLGRAGRVSDAFEFVSSLGPEGDQPEVWGSVLGACGVHKEFELGRKVAEKMSESGGGDVAGYKVLVSNMFASERDWESVGRVRKEMREKGVRKETGRSWIETSSGSVSRFSAKDRSHERSDEIYEMLGQLVEEMRASRTEQ